ncbi:MAG: chemotaxis protein CheR [Proteobacteria bacterium]|nr:chemotaxis protein CheR [Pseudomonadota bacterium]
MNAAIEKGFEFSDRDFRFIRTMVSEKTGIELAEHKKNMVYSRLVRRIRTLNIGGFREYCEILSSDSSGSELINFVNAITTNVTRFFREEHHFHYLRDVVVKELTEQKPEKIRIWSAGCSVGMEAYSIAMTMLSAMPELAYKDFKILATDIDTEVLGKGAAATYPSEVLKDIPQEYHRKYLETSDDGETVTVTDELRKFVTFKRMNFLDHWPVKGQFQVIFCRNVVIYFNKEVQRAIFDKFADRMVDNGCLCIGHSENLFNVSTRFRSVGTTIYRKIA